MCNAFLYNFLFVSPLVSTFVVRTRFFSTQHTYFYLLFICCKIGGNNFPQFFTHLLNDDGNSVGNGRGSVEYFEMSCTFRMLCASVYILNKTKTNIPILHSHTYTFGICTIFFFIITKIYVGLWMAVDAKIIMEKNNNKSNEQFYYFKKTMIESVFM